MIGLSQKVHDNSYIDRMMALLVVLAAAAYLTVLNTLLFNTGTGVTLSGTLVHSRMVLPIASGVAW